MKSLLAAVCVGLLVATVVCLGDEDEDLMRSLLLDGDVKSQFTPIHQFVNGFVQNNFYNCQAYCNGVEISDLETPGCLGLFVFECNYKYNEVEGKSKSACLGSFKRTKTSGKADVYCDGAWHSHSWDTITIHGIDACSVSGFTCGGFLNVVYNLLPPPPSPNYEKLNAEQQEVNYTCKGTEVHSSAMSKEPATDVSIEDLSATVDAYFRDEFGLKTDFMSDKELQELESNHYLEDSYQHDFNCTATCSGRQVDPMALQICFTEFEESCMGSFHNQSFSFSQACDGIFKSSPEFGSEDCLGKYTFDLSGEHGSADGYCTRVFGTKWVKTYKGVAKYEVCHGESFFATKHEKMPEEEKEKEGVWFPVA